MNIYKRIISVLLLIGFTYTFFMMQFRGVTNPIDGVLAALFPSFIFAAFFIENGFKKSLFNFTILFMWLLSTAGALSRVYNWPFHR
jgi:hypothetical protein